MEEKGGSCTWKQVFESWQSKGRRPSHAQQEKGSGHKVPFLLHDGTAGLALSWAFRSSLLEN